MVYLLVLNLPKRVSVVMSLLNMLNVTSGTLRASAVKWLIRCAFDISEWKCVGHIVSSIVQTWGSFDCEQEAVGILWVSTIRQKYPVTILKVTITTLGFVLENCFLLLGYAV